MNKTFIAFLGICCHLVAAEEENLLLCASKSPKSKCDLNTEPFQRGDATLEMMATNGKYPAAYNQAGNIQLNRGWDVYGDISYLYWFIEQEGLDLATTAEYMSDLIYAPGSGGYPVFQDTGYTSGFKVGLGGNLNVDDWALDAEYTYLRQSTTTAKTAPVSTDVGFLGVFNFTGWFFDDYYAQSLVAQSFKSKWKFGLDWVDLMIKRPYYLGRKLIATPSLGLRASWIRQELKITAFDSEFSDTAEGTLTTTNNSHSWAVGPRGLIDFHWLMGMGFRLQSNFGMSLLFTQFTSITHLASNFDEDPDSLPFAIKNYNCVRPMAESNLGIGWGGYFSSNRYHLDLSATYDFNFLWGQNMLKYMVNLGGFGRGPSPYDLLMHGLTIKSRFDF